MSATTQDRQWTLERGASARPDGSTRFAVWAPAAERVAVVLHGRAHPLTPGADGEHSAVVADAPPGTDYLYRLTAGSDRRERADPVSRFQPAGVHGPSRIVDPHAFSWRDAGWQGLAMADYVLYELHVGTFTDAGTFDAVAEHLRSLRELGVTAVELMPVGEFPGGRNWGYDGVAPYAPQSTYGGPEGLRRLVDAAHATGLAVVLDVVYNHLGPEGNHLADFGPYFTDRYRTPWGPAVNFDGPGSDAVRRYAIDNALYWVTEFHVDGLRLDAVHAIYDASARHVLAELASAVHAQARRLGRRVQVIAESDANDPRLVREAARGGYDLDAQWSDDFHHAVHAALTGEANGYYADFGGVAPVGKALRDRFVYDGQHSRFRSRPHGSPARDLPADRFVVFIQNHDQVGNRAGGERLAALVPFPQQKLAAALLLLSPYVPLLFMGEEYGETNPFLYFVSHGAPELIEAVRRGRRAEFAAFAWAGEVPDPQAETTFSRSRLDRRRLREPTHCALRDLHHDLLALRRSEAGLRPGASAMEVAADSDTATITVSFLAPEAPPLLAAFNLGATTRALALPRAGAGAWHVLVSTEASRYAGRDEPAIDAGGAHGLLPGFAAALYRQDTR